MADVGSISTPTEFHDQSRSACLPEASNGSRAQITCPRRTRKWHRGSARTSIDGRSVGLPSQISYRHAGAEPTERVGMMTRCPRPQGHSNTTHFASRRSGTNAMESGARTAGRSLIDPASITCRNRGRGCQPRRDRRRSIRSAMTGPEEGPPRQEPTVRDRRSSTRAGRHADSG